MKPGNFTPNESSISLLTRPGISQDPKIEILTDPVFQLTHVANPLKATAGTQGREFLRASLKSVKNGLYHRIISKMNGTPTLSRILETGRMIEYRNNLGRCRILVESHEGKAEEVLRNKDLFTSKVAQVYQESVIVSERSTAAFAGLNVRK